MRAIRIRNLRSLADTGFIDLKPITLLLGQNSSGKSTFLRSFPLLRQSIESRTTGPILWFGRFVDFGSFQEAVLKSSSESEMSFHFRFNMSDKIVHPIYREAFVSKIGVSQGLEVELTLCIMGDQKQETSWASGCLIRFEKEHEIEIRYEKDSRVTIFKVNGRDFSELSNRLHSIIMRSGLIPTFVDRSSEDRGKSSLYFSHGGIFFNVLFDHIRNLVHKNTRDETVLALAQSLRIGSSIEMLQNMQSTPRSTPTWEEIAANWTTEHPSFHDIRDLVIANAVPSLLSSCDDYLSVFATNNRYIAPVRATAERYYRLQDLAVDEVDFQGQNLPMFLRNLTQSELRRFSEWTERSFGFSVEVVGSGGHISLKLRERGSNNNFNLADKGFGFSQILPILTQLWAIGYQRGRRPRASSSRRDIPVTFSIEQPELHLHPYLQSQLIDAFIASVDAARDIGVDLRLLLETHSETIVNRIGNRVYSRAIDKSQVNVVLFEKKGVDDPTSIQTSTYDDKGYLVNWPFGFFEPSND